MSFDTFVLQPLGVAQPDSAVPGEEGKSCALQLEIATGFTPGGPKCLIDWEIRKRGKQESP